MVKRNSIFVDEPRKNMHPTSINNHFYRSGPSHRDGADVTFGDIVKIFGFRSAKVGAWFSKREQQAAANLFFDALCDLMTILQVNEQVISLRRTLFSIAFGSGGNKYISAHYNYATRTIALRVSRDSYRIRQIQLNQLLIKEFILC